MNKLRAIHELRVCLILYSFRAFSEALFFLCEWIDVGMSSNKNNCWIPELVGN
jgi:hypothetical protein